MSKELSLGTTVSFSERMGKVEVVIQIRNFLCQCIISKAPQAISFLNLGSDVCNWAIYLGRWHKWFTPAFCNSHCPQITRPLIHILK